MNEDIQQHNLKKLYAEETRLRRYIRLTVGEDASIGRLIWHELLLGICTGLPGIAGLVIRNKLYRKFFPGFHSNAFTGKQVTLRCPAQITLSEGVLIDDFVQLIATSSQKNAIFIGANTFLRSFAMINAGPPQGFVHIGANSSIGQATILYGNGGLTIGNNVMISGQCFIVASSHNFSNSSLPMSEQGYSARGITIHDNVWIGAGAKILDGITVGEGAIIGANAVVTKSVSPQTRVAGVPAREIKNQHEHDE